VVDHHLVNRHAQLAGNGRQEAVHLAVQPQRLDHLGPEDLERAPVIVQRHARGPRNDPVGDNRRQAPRDEGIFPVLPPPADNVVAGLDARHHLGNVARVVLQVAI